VRLFRWFCSSYAVHSTRLSSSFFSEGKILIKRKKAIYHYLTDHVDNMRRYIYQINLGDPLTIIFTDVDVIATDDHEPQMTKEEERIIIDQGFNTPELIVHCMVQQVYMILLSCMLLYNTTSISSNYTWYYRHVYYYINDTTSYMLLYKSKWGQDLHLLCLFHMFLPTRGKM